MLSQHRQLLWSDVSTQQHMCDVGMQVRLSAWRQHAQAAHVECSGWKSAASTGNAAI